MPQLEQTHGFPRIRLAHTPTPLEPLPRLSEALGGPEIWVKRDDCTGLALGGNKARQLEYYLGAALFQEADTVLITGAVQSNFLRTTAGAAAKLGLACEIQHEDRVPDMAGSYHASGNVLLDRLLGATIATFPEGENETGADATLEARAAELRAAGRRPYVIHLSAAHPPLGALGYVDAAAELLQQIKEQAKSFDAVVIASGSALTHCGALAGLRLLGSPLRTVGICVRRAVTLQAPRVLQRAQELAAMLERPGLVGEADVEVHDKALGPGYGRLDDSTFEALTLAARLEGLLLDPVYSAKTLAGLIALVRAGAWTKDQRVIFYHTGGAPALFGYGEVLEGFLEVD